MPVSSKYHRYNCSPKGRARNKRYQVRHLLQVEKRNRDYYHRLQDEAGCHMKTREFYPGFRLLRALETADVVEI